MSTTEQPHSKAWYLVPLLFGILGGLVMYIGLKTDAPKMAKKGLIVSIVVTAASGLIYIPLIFMGVML